MQLGENQKFATPEEALAHHGVKGMKWGVRKDDSPKDRAVRNDQTKSLIAAAKVGPVSKTQAVRNLSANIDKAADKFAKSDASGDKQGLTDSQKQLLVGGVAAIGLVGGAYLLRNSAKPHGLISPSDYVDLKQNSIKNVWSTNDYIRPETLARQSFTLPAGHEFLRVSQAKEDSFGFATYTSSSVEDYARYLVGHADVPPVGIHKVAFSAKQEIKVPSTKEILDTLRDTMHEQGVGDVSDKAVVDRFRRLSGGYWNEPDGVKLFSKLSEKGYSAIVDEMDAGVQSERPLVIINNSHFGPKTSTLLTAKDVKETMKHLREINNRKM